MNCLFVILKQTKITMKEVQRPNRLQMDLFGLLTLEATDVSFNEDRKLTSREVPDKLKVKQNSAQSLSHILDKLILPPELLIIDLSRNYLHTLTSNILLC